MVISLSRGHVARRRPRTALLRAVKALPLVAATLFFAATAVHAQTTDDELLVGFRAGVSAPARSAMLRQLGAEIVEDIERSARFAVVRVAPHAFEAVARKLASQPEVAFVERNDALAPALVPDDPQYATQWYLPQIRAPQAWDLTQGARGAVIAVLDSGVDPHHPDLAGKLVAGTNTYDTSGVTADQQGHGTKMAGVAAARTNNAAGIAGVAGASPVMPVRVTDRKGRATSASIAKGIVWAADHGARVLNLSLEGVIRSAAIRDAAEYAFKRGALVVAPSGNCGCVSPVAETPFILSVAATDESDQAAPFSAAGAFVDIAAPGTNIPTTAMFGAYLGDTGTSVASAVVAGVASLMFAANPALTPEAATRILQDTAFDPQHKGRDPQLGHGRVDAFAAVSAAKAWRAPAAADDTAKDGGASGAGTAATAVRAP